MTTVANSSCNITDTDTKNKDDDICPICKDDMEDDKITLKCNHSFCYECLLESFRGTKCNYTAPKTHRICPYCRTPASYLSLKKGVIPIKGIHREFGKFTNKPIGFIQCGGVIKSGVNKGNQCSNNSKEGTHFCGKHTPKVIT